MNYCPNCGAKISFNYNFCGKVLKTFTDEEVKIRKKIESMLYELNINLTDELLEYLIKIKK